MPDPTPTLDRRSFLVLATLSGGGLLAGCASRDRQQLRGTRTPPPAGRIALNGWLEVGTDGTVTVVMARSEMGQGVHTALAMLVAEELDCAWSQIRLRGAPVDPLYGNVAAMADGVPFRPDDDGALARSMRWVLTAAMRQVGLMMTGGSSSLRDLWLPMRHAAAATRATLVEAVARHWQLAVAQVSVDDGRFGAPDGRTLPLGEAVGLLGPQPRVPGRVGLKPAARFRLLGRPTPRLDSPAKVDGSAVFGIDVRPPGLLYAAVRFSPTRGGRVARLRDEQARALPGVAGVVVLEPAQGGSAGVAVVADGWWRARKALDALQVDFEAGPAGSVSTDQAMNTMATALDREDGFAFWKHGDARAAIAAGGRTVQAEYRAPYLAHATMEPMNCTVLLEQGRATVWAPTQVPGLARRAAARALGLDEAQVQVEVPYLGGGFGRRLEVDFVAQAAAIAARFPGRPVQLLWSREDDLQHDFYRPGCVARCAAALDDQGRITAWHHASASQAIAPQWLPRTAGMPVIGPDKTTAEGAFDAAYEFPAALVRHVTVELPIPVGFWRAVGHSHQAFFKESFVDECAHAAGADPVQYRLALLARHPRQRAVLELAAARAGWGRPAGTAPDGAPLARGVALHESFGAIVAQVAEVSIAADRTIRVHRVVCAIDCGFAVNPDGIAQQMDSGVVFGLSAALHGRIDIDGGRVRQSNFHDYRALRLSDSPLVETHIVPSDAAPQGVGEPGLPPVAPAVANAVFALSGQRLRTLPLSLTAAGDGPGQASSKPS